MPIPLGEFDPHKPTEPDLVMTKVGEIFTKVYTGKDPVLIEKLLRAAGGLGEEESFAKLTSEEIWEKVEAAANMCHIFGPTAVAVAEIEV